MRIALAGNPNSGKTTLFNVLTGSTAHVGNWPGVTVDRKEGVHKRGGEKISIIDLPGIYSLSPYSPEEVVARNFILEESPEAIINIVDATNIERNLYLTTQLLESDVPVVVALNMTDMAEKNNIRIDTKLLEKELGVPVVPISALLKQGLDKLMDAAVKAAGEKRKGVSVISEGKYADALSKIEEVAREEKLSHPKFKAVKLLEGDDKGIDVSDAAKAKISEIKKGVRLPAEFEGDFEATVANERYDIVGGRYSKAVKRAKNSEKLTGSDKIDRILTSRLFGLPIFFVLMFLVFHVTFGEDLFFLSSLGLSEGGILSPGVWMLEQTGVFIDWISGFATAGLNAVSAPEWCHGLIVDGVLAGVGAVLSFMPQILLLFLFLSIMEDSGYMARAAFLMDRILRRFGLSGKAFMPLLMCFGCLVPAIMGSRTLENDRERKLMIMLAPFFSCGAKLPIWGMFAMALFPENADLLVFAIYMIGIITAVIAAIILKYTILRGEASPFIMELPPYHMPLIKNVVLNLWEKLKGYIYRAATIIAGATVVIWFLSNFSLSLDLVESASRESILGFFGTHLQFLFEPLGWASGDIGWKAVVAALTGLIAKEMVVSTMGVLYDPGVEGDALEDETASSALALSIIAVFSPLAAISYMAFNLLSVPCMAAVATAHSELRSAKWTWTTIAFWIGTAWVVSFLIFQVGSLFGLGTEMVNPTPGQIEAAAQIAPAEPAPDAPVVAE